VFPRAGIGLLCAALLGAAVYFHSNSDNDSTFEAEPDALDAFRTVALDPYFNSPPPWSTAFATATSCDSW
jgi:hypothetical protein